MTGKEQLVGMLETLNSTRGVSKSEFEGLIGYLTNEVVAWMHDEQQLISRDLLSDALETLNEPCRSCTKNAQYKMCSPYSDGTCESYSGKVTEQEKHIKSLVEATLIVYRRLPDAQGALKKLHPEQQGVEIQEPASIYETLRGISTDYYLLDEALSWVVNGTAFRDQKDGESGIEWLEAYLEEGRND